MEKAPSGAFSLVELNINSDTDMEVVMIFDDKTDLDLYLSLEAETAKSLSEIRCAKKDLEQAEVRLRFVLTTIHHLKQRFEGK
jgi:hypothetical protein